MKTPSSSRSDGDDMPTANPLLEMEGHRAPTTPLEECSRSLSNGDASLPLQSPPRKHVLPQHYFSIPLEDGQPQEEGPPILWNTMPDELFRFVDIPSQASCASGNEEAATLSPGGATEAAGSTPTCGRWSARYPPTRACMPNGIVAALLLGTCFMAVNTMTERVFFVVENETLCTVSATMWTVTRTEIKRGQNSTELGVTGGLFPGCDSASLSATLSIVRAAAIGSAINCLLASVVMVVDGALVALRRYMCVVPILASCVCVAARWIAEEQLFRVDFCDTPSLLARGFIMTASLTVNVLSVIFLPIALFVCVVWYPLHHPTTTAVADMDADDDHRMTALRDPLIVGAGLGALFAI